MALFGLACLTAPAPALSQVTCGCYLSYCPARDSPFLRFELATPLAPNARILARLSGFDPGSVELETTASDPVAFALEPAGDAAGTAYWIVPAAPLMPGDYLLSATSLAERSVATEAFSVAGGDDVTPPAVSGLRVAGVSASNYCSDLVGGVVSYSAVDPGLVYTAVALEVELWRGGVRFARVFPAQAYRSQPTEFGTSPAPDCFGAAHVDGLREGEELTARVRAWDMAGNATPFESSTFTVGRWPGRPSCHRSCSAAPWARGSGRTLGPMSVLLVLGASRRSRRR